MSDVTDVLKQYSKDVVKTIEENLSVIEPQDLQDACLYLTKAGGKMLRPALTLISAEAVGGNKEDALKTAAALELIHTFSLIHDDIMDDDDMRRGMPSVHKVWDEPVAILAGDTLFSKAFEMVIASKEEDAHPTNVANALATVADACVKICEGQASDMSFEGNFDVKTWIGKKGTITVRNQKKKPEYKEIVLFKTKFETKTEEKAKSDGDLAAERDALEDKNFDIF